MDFTQSKRTILGGRNAVLLTCSAFLLIFHAFITVDTVVMHSYTTYPIRWVVTQFLRGGVYTCLLLAPAFLLGKKSRWFYIPFFCYRYLLCVVSLFVYCKFNWRMDGDVLLLVLTSSWEETWQFLRLFVSFGGLCSLTAVFLCGVLGVRFIVRATYPSVSLRNCFWGICLLFPFIACETHSGQWLEESVRATGGTFAWDAQRKVKATVALERACKRPDLPSQVETTVPIAELPTVVLVIGESSTRNHWHLYGYPHRTTDCLDAIKDELVIFKDVNTVDVGTCKSLRFLLTCATTGRPDDFRYTFSSVVSRAGYRPAFYTMTQRWGAGMGGISVLFDGCEDRCI